MKMNKLRMLTISMMMFFFTSFMVYGQTKTDLTPDEEYMAKEEPREIVTKVKDNVEITVGSDTWDGDNVVAKNVIPLRVTVDNAREDPIVISYNNFDLENSDGREYSVIPLYKYDVDLNKIVMENEYRPVPNSFYELSNFYVYPIYSPIYTGVQTTSYNYVIDPNIQKKYFLWSAMDEELPTQNMRNKVLTEGVLDEDGIVSGYLFFEDVLPTDEMVTFNFEIVNANTGEKEGTIEIPYYVTMD